MLSDRSSNIRVIQISVIALIAIIVLGYAIWRSFDYARGPIVLINEPINGTSIHASSTVLIGQAYRINSLYVNSNPIEIDEQGNFKETIIIFPGTNYITISGKDQFGRETKTVLTLLGTK